jgi:hypothetical protein
MINFRVVFQILINEHHFSYHAMMMIILNSLNFATNPLANNRNSFFDKEQEIAVIQVQI